MVVTTAIVVETTGVAVVVLWVVFAVTFELEVFFEDCVVEDDAEGVVCEAAVVEVGDVEEGWEVGD